MSHHSIYKTEIRIKENTLVKAVKKLAEELGCQTVESVYDAYGHGHSVLIGIKPRDLPRGIGFNISNGKLTVEGDDWGCVNTFHHYSELAKNYINAYLTRKRAYALYPNAKVKTEIRGSVVEMEVVL